jgi:hypothetical protein
MDGEPITLKRCAPIADDARVLQWLYLVEITPMRLRLLRAFQLGQMYERMLVQQLDIGR